MANPKRHWAIPTNNPRKHRHPWMGHAGGYYAKACGRKYCSDTQSGSASAFLSHVEADPDWHCADCAKAARLALAKESALCRDLRSGAHTKVLSPTPYDAPIKRRVRKSSEGRGPRATPPRPFTPRSLVGMSQGARKRVYRKAVFDLEHGEVWKGDVVDRSRLRIGQKLRPCAGCIRCECQTAFDVWPKLGEALAKDLPTCDGSGVLPAQKEKS